MRGTVAGAAVVCGSRTWLHELGIDTAALAALPDLHAQAKTELCVTRCGVVLGALGIANMWVAIFADVGVMVLCVLNAARALNTKHL